MLECTRQGSPHEAILFLILEPFGELAHQRGIPVPSEEQLVAWYRVAQNPKFHFDRHLLVALPRRWRLDFLFQRCDTQRNLESLHALLAQLSNLRVFAELAEVHGKLWARRHLGFEQLLGKRNNLAISAFYTGNSKVILWLSKVRINGWRK